MSDHKIAESLRGKLIDGNVVSNAAPPSSPVPNAWIDPWVAVPALNFGAQLFGFVTRHPDGPALSWVGLGAITTYNEAKASATTIHGLHVKVGRRVETDDLPDLGIEAMVAFRLSFDRGPTLTQLVPLLSTTDASKRWLHACVRSRHLGLSCPPPKPGPVERLLTASDKAWHAFYTQARRPH